jgi:single-strand DNA-binding protein
MPISVTLSGRIGGNVEFKDIPLKDKTGSFEIAEASLAVNPSKDTTDWYKLTIQGDGLLKAANYIEKGSVLSVVGDLMMESWQDSDGNYRYKPTVRVRQLQLPSTGRHK